MTASGAQLDVVGAYAPLAYFGRLTSAELAHAYLFYGSGGVGKKTFARRLAQSLLCQEEKPGVLGYDGTCPACTAFVAGTHPDFHESIGTVKIGDTDSASDDNETTTRDLIREMMLRPYSGRWRVALLGDVAFATEAAANALLKFLEEPPPNVLLILTSSNPGSLLPTLRSRSIAVEFGPARSSEIAAALEREGVPSDRAAIAADASLGSVGRAKEIVNNAADGLRAGSFSWFAAAVRGRTPDAGFLGLSDRDLSAAQKRSNVNAMLETIRAVARDWLAMRLADGEIRFAAPDAQAMLTALPARSPGDILAAVEGIEEVAGIAESNVSAALVVDYLRMRLAPA